MKPRKPMTSIFIRSVQNARIGQALRQKWKPMRMRSARVSAAFKRERAYNGWLLDTYVKEMRRKFRRSPLLGETKP